LSNYEKLIALVLVLAVGLIAGQAFTAEAVRADDVTEIEFWYALSGDIEEATLEFIEGFNETHPDVEINPVHRGTYSEVLTTAIAAYGTPEAPHIVQVSETLGTQTLSDSEAVYPAHEILDDYGYEVDWGDFLEPFQVEGELKGLPFNNSVPILYYNKDAFAEAGLDPEQPPETYEDVEEMGEQLVESGAAEYAMTVGWPSWLLVENAHTWHGQPFADNDGGFDGHATELYINREFGVEMFEIFKDWHERDILTYEGREGDPNPSFLTGETAIIQTSTGYLSGFEESADFELGTGFMPHNSDYPQGNAWLGGGRIWALQGHEAEEYEAVAEFMNYVTQPEQQAEWHRRTGYLPTTQSAAELLEEEGWFEENPNHATAVEQVTVEIEADRLQGIRLGEYTAIRDAILDNMEAMFAGQKDIQTALDDAVEQGNSILDRYLQQIQ